MASSIAHPLPADPSAETGRGGQLAAKPIMIYPLTPEDRQSIVDAAREATPPGKKVSVSSFIMTTMLNTIREQKKPQKKK